MKTMHTKNYALLALAIIYFIIAVIQSSVDGILGTQLYFSVAFISLSTTLCEATKSIIQLIHTLNKQINHSRDFLYNNAKKHISIFSQHTELKGLAEEYERIHKEAQHTINPGYKKQWQKVLSFIERIIPFVEVFSVLCVAIIDPLKIIPNTLQTAKTINVLTLLSVALAFLSIYINDTTSAMICRNNERLTDYQKVSDYYLDIIEKISTGQSGNEAMRSQENNELGSE